MGEQRILIGLAVLTGIAAAVGGGWILPVLFGVLLACAAHRPTRDHVVTACAEVWMRTPWRAALIVVGAMALWQLLGVELALLMAGDVLAYVEVLVAVNLIAARTRWAPMKQALVARLRDRVGGIRIRITPRSTRAVRPPRRPSPGRDADDRPATGVLAPAWA